VVRLLCEGSDHVSEKMLGRRYTQWPSPLAPEASTISQIPYELRLSQFLVVRNAAHVILTLSTPAPFNRLRPMMSEKDSWA
jgi:hypothetical protein